MSQRHRHRFRMARIAVCRPARPCATSRTRSLRTRQGGARRRGRRQARRPDVSPRPGRRGADRHRQEPRGAGAAPAQHRAPAGGGRHQPVSRRAVRHRSGDRRRLLLRLRRAASVRAGGSRGDRSEDERAGLAGPRLRAADVAARRGQGVLRQARRAAQGAADRREDRRSDRGVRLHHQGQGHLRRLLRRPARADHRQAEGVQAAHHVERVLEGRREQPADAARLRHRVPPRRI